MVTCPRCRSTYAPHAARCPSCGAAAPTVALSPAARPEPEELPATLGRHLPPGTRLGPYVVRGLIGEGGMSAVYAAHDDVVGRSVAVKVLHPNLVGDRGIRIRFLREGRITRGWSHPNIVPVLDTVRVSDIYGIVMEHVPAPTLAGWLERWRGPVPTAEIGQLALGLLAGLEEAHGRGVVHRDLKPGNVLVVNRDVHLVPRIIDFGIARVLEGTTYTLTGAVMGTCRYMSPEQVRSEPVGPPSDLYSLGAVLYELATGRPPFDDEQPFAVMMAHTQREPPSVSSLRPDLPGPLAAAIDECLKKDAAARPPSASGLREILEGALSCESERRSPRVGRVANDHDLVLVEAGAFLMGPDRRRVYVDAFSLDRHPVTNRQFAWFLQATGYRPDDPRGFLAHWPSPEGPAPSQQQLPVVHVSVADALAYAGWLGLRLPTEAEWEKSARGVDGRRFPWGREAPTNRHAWFGKRGGPGAIGARPAGASPYGHHDLAGNVWEWCGEVDDPSFYAAGPDRNPRRPPRGDGRPQVIRGGAWMFDDPRSLRTWSRSSQPPDVRLATVGFRCAG